MSPVLFEEKLLPIVTDLEMRPMLWPDLTVNTLFEKLVNFVIESPECLLQGMDMGLIHRVRKLAAKGEFCLEKYWAEKVLLGADIKTFSYYRNYLKLVDFEIAKMKKLTDDLREIIFFGSGPLPLTAVLMAQNYGIQIKCVDCDQEAVRWAGLLVKALGLGNSIEIIGQNFFDFDDYGNAQVVLIGALVGGNEEEKAQVVERVKQVKKPNQRALLRTACGLKKLLYPAVPEHLGTLICPADKTLINSLIVI